MLKKFADFLEDQRNSSYSFKQPINNLIIPKKSVDKDVLEPNLEQLPDPEGAPVEFTPTNRGDFVRWLMNKLMLLTHDPKNSLWAKSKYQMFQNPNRLGMREVITTNAEANEKLLTRIDSFLSKTYNRGDKTFDILRSNKKENLTFWITNLFQSKYADLDDKISDVFVKLRSGEIRHPDMLKGIGEPSKIDPNQTKQQRNYKIQNLFNRSFGKSNYELSPQEQEKIRYMRKYGWTDEQIADETGNYIKHVKNVI